MKKAKQPKLLLEQTLKAIHAERVDREKGVIYGVRMGGLQSGNKREYIPESYKGAINDGLYEGIPCNIDHVREGEKVKVGSRFGVWRNVKYRDGAEPGPYGDLHYIKSHQLAENVVEAAEREELNNVFGMSHDAYADKYRPGKNGKTIVESFESMKSVDLVADPATTKGLFEDKDIIPMKDLKTLIESALQFPFQKKEWLELCKDDCINRHLVEEIDAPENKTAVELANTAFDALAAWLVKEDIDPDELGKKVASLRKAKAKIMEGEQPEDDEDDDEDDDDGVGDLKKAKEAKMVTTDEVYRIAEQLEFMPTPKQMRVLLKLEGSVAKELLEEFATSASKTHKARSAPRLPIEESTDNNDQPAADVSSFSARCFE